MVNINKVTRYWCDAAREDWLAAEALLEKKMTRQALFFVHLALEKMLKAHVLRATRDTPPRIHDLVRLADLGRVALPQHQRDFLALMNRFCLAGRYPDDRLSRPSLATAKRHLARAQEILDCLRG